MVSEASFLLVELLIYSLVNSISYTGCDRMHHKMTRGCKASGAKRIRIHDLRHSHVSLLIDMDYSAVAIADRLGHESTDITFRYAHLFPDKQREIARALDEEGRG